MPSLVKTGSCAIMTISVKKPETNNERGGTTYSSILATQYEVYTGLGGGPPPGLFRMQLAGHKPRVV